MTSRRGFFGAIAAAFAGVLGSRFRIGETIGVRKPARYLVREGPPLSSRMISIYDSVENRFVSRFDVFYGLGASPFTPGEYDVVVTTYRV